MNVLFCITTTDSEEKAREIQDTILKEKLAVCISITNLKSKYWWKEGIEETEEFFLMIKTLPSLKEKLDSRIKEIHNYSVPEIIFFDGKSSEAYFNWMSSVLK